MLASAALLTTLVHCAQPMQADATDFAIGWPPREIAAASGDGGVAGSEPCPAPFLTQSVEPFLINGASSAVCQGGGITAETSLAREFLSDPTGLVVTCVTFGVDINVGGAWTVDVRLLLGDIDQPLSELTLLAEQSVSIPSNTNDALFTAEFENVAIPANAPFVVELRGPSRVPSQGGDGGFLALGCNSAGESAPTYLRAPLCGIPEFLPAAALGLPATQVVMTVGVIASNPCSGNDVCPVGAFDEGEPCGTSVNGGPFGDPPGSTPIACGESVCGSFYWVPPIRDTDWYEIAIAECTCIKWRVYADVALSVFIIDSAGSIVGTGIGSCPTFAAACLPPGTYYLFVAPSFNNPPIFCGDGATTNYVADVTCTPCPENPPSCCNEFGTGFLDPECAAIVCSINPNCCDHCDGECEQLALAYCDCCRPCTLPPTDMVSWWTFDEPVGATSFADSAGGHTGTGVGGPTSVPGKVGNALSFNGTTQEVSVAPTAAHEFGPGAFSIDAWVKWNGTGAGGILSYPTISAPLGGEFGLHVTATGNVSLLLMDECQRTCTTSPSSLITANTWTHVALTASACTCIPIPQQNLECCDSNPTRVFRIYINGVLMWTYSFPPHWCDVTNALGVSIGRGSFCSDFFPGLLDEVQMFSRELSLGEIQALYLAGSAGKCKHRCHIPWDRQYGPAGTPGSTSVTVPLTICNDSPNSAQFQIDLEAATPFAGCNGPNLTTFLVGGANPVTIPGNTCVAIPITIPRPAGLDVGEVSCYRACVTNLATGVRVYCFGSVVRSDFVVATPLPSCCIFSWAQMDNPDVVLPLPDVGEPLPLWFSVEQFGSQPTTVPYQIRVAPSDMHAGPIPVSLNGLPPGEPVIGTLLVPPGTAATLTAEATFVAPAPFQYFDVIVALDSDGDGSYVDTFSVGIASGPVPEPAPPCPPDLNGDGVVDGGDLALLLGNWGQTDRKETGDLLGDLNGDGIVNGADLASLLGAWGKCK